MEKFTNGSGLFNSDIQYPDTDAIKDKAQRITPIIYYNDSVFKATAMILLFLGIILGVLFYLRSKGLTIAGLFRDLGTKLHPKKAVRISPKQMIIPN